MAEKKEFIFVFGVEENDELYNITPYCNGCTFWPCDEECINRKKPMTRQEAIDRMTVAMCKFDCTDNERACENCNEWEKYDKCESLAEAALNALLEDNK